MKAIDDSEYGGWLEDEIWTFSVWDNVDKTMVNRKALSGIISSLNKKGYVVSEECGKESTIGMTKAGAKAYLKQAENPSKPMMPNK